VLFVVSAFLFFLRSGRWREWIAFGAGVSIVAVPELVWAMTGSATRLTEFVAWNFGWDLRGENFIWFWLKNLGIFTPILIFGIYLVYSLRKNEKENESPIETDKRRLKKDIYHLPFTIYHLYFYLPFLFCFVVANLVKLAPWEWDNIKI